MELKTKQIRHKQKKAKTESEYENAAFHKSKRISTGHENYYDEVETLSVQNLEIRLKAQPNEYSQWNNESSDVYANHGAVDESSQGSIYVNQEGVSKNQSEDETKLPLPVSPPSSSGEYIWKILAILCAILFIGTGIAFVVVVLPLYSKESPCDGIGCLNNGTCSVHDDTLVCTCLDGFNGTRCEGTPCDRGLCENMGTCFLQNLEPRCACLSGFTGPNCSVTPCDSDPCFNGGVCTYILNDPSPMCNCRKGFTGKACEITPCFGDPCLNDGTCTFSPNNDQPKCTCKSGYSGSLCQETPCTSSPCENHGVCNVSGNGYSCTCVDGYTGTHCTEIRCSAEANEYLSCMFLQDYFDSGDWNRINVNGIGNSYYVPSSAGYTRFVSTPIQSDKKRCVSFEYYIYMYPLVPQQPYLYVMRNKDQLTSFTTSSGASAVWTSTTRTIGTFSYDIQITFNANLGHTINQIRLKNIRIYYC